MHRWAVSLVLLASVHAGCAARVPARVVYRDGHRTRLAAQAEEALECHHATLTPLGSRVVQAHGCGEMREYVFAGRHGWTPIATVPGRAPRDLACPLDLLDFRSEGPLIRVVEGCGARARYDLGCDAERCEWRVTARSAARAEPSEDALDLWPDPPASLSLGIEEPRLTRGRDAGLIGVGLALAIVGLGGSIGLGIYDAAHASCLGAPVRGLGEQPTACDAGGLALVPVVGGLLASTVALGGRRVSNGGTILAGALLGGAQLVGIVLLMVAVHGYTEDVVPAGVRLSPYADQAGGGLSLEGRW